nr:hypothetical protein [Tanacetum cinerariifolium]
MNQEQIQQPAHDEALVTTDDRVKIGLSNMRIDPTLTQKEETYQVILDIIKNSPCYNAFLITADVPEIYMQKFWFTVKRVKKSSFYQFDLDDKKFQVDVEIFEKILRICPRVPDKEFVALPFPYSLVTFIKELGFTKIIIHYFLSKHKSISMRPGSYVNIIKDDAILGRLKFIGKGEETQEYGLVIPDTMLTEENKNSEAYLTFLAISTGIIPPKKRRGKGAKGKRETITPKKKSSITADDKLIPNLDELKVRKVN